MSNGSNKYNVPALLSFTVKWDVNKAVNKPSFNNDNNNFNNDFS